MQLLTDGVYFVAAPQSGYSSSYSSSYSSDSEVVGLKLSKSKACPVGF